MQHGLGLSYGQLGLLVSVPIVLGGALELPLGLLAGHGRRRRLVVLGGGLMFIATVAAVAFARNFVELLAAFVLFYPASGAFVTLTEAALLDAEPDRQAQLMARWGTAGWAGALTGPLLYAGVIAAGGGWQTSFLVMAAVSALTWLAMFSVRAGDNTDDEEPAGWRELKASLRWPVLRLLVVLEVTNWLVDVLTGFIAVYLVDVVHTSPAVAALGVSLRLAAGLGGNSLLIVLLRKLSDLTILRATALIALLLFPGFLLVPGLAAKLGLLTLLSAATATWYPLLEARLYGAVPSPVAVTLTSAAGLAGGLGPLAVGAAAALLGLSWAMAGLTLVPAALLWLLRSDRTPPQAHPGRQ